MHQGGTGDRSSTKYQKAAGGRSNGNEHRGHGPVEYFFFDADFKIDLNRLCENRRAIKLENMSPVIYRLEQPLKKVMVYRTGKLMFWGAKSINDMETAFMIMRKEMQAYEMAVKPEHFDPNEQETCGVVSQWGF